MKQYAFVTRFNMKPWEWSGSKYEEDINTLLMFDKFVRQHINSGEQPGKMADRIREFKKGLGRR